MESVDAVLIFILLGKYYPKAGAFLLAAAVHEAGHLAAAHILGANTQFSLGIMGLKIKYSAFTLHIAKSCIICVAGSAVGILSSLAVLASPLSKYDMWMYYALVSETLSFVNMLPIKSLDGGALLELILEKEFFPSQAAKISRVVSLLFSVMFWILGIYIYFTRGANLSLMIIATYFIFSSILED